MIYPQIDADKHRFVGFIMKKGGVGLTMQEYQKY